MVASGVLFISSLAAVPMAPDGASDGWHQVEFADRVTAADRAGLDSSYVLPAGGSTYLTWGDPGYVPGAAVTSVRDKVHPAARSAAQVLVLAHPDAAEGLTRILGVTPEATPAGLVRFVTPGDLLPVDELAADEGVLHIGPASSGLHPEDEASAQILAGNSDFTFAPPGYADFLESHGGLTGEGVRVSIVDTGIDRLHPDLADRVVAHLDYTPAGEPHDAYGHGTHVAGIVGGNGGSGGLHITDEEGRLYGLGVAPGVELLDQNAIALTAPEWPPAYGFETLTSDAIAHGTHIWNASWTTGEGEGVGYIGTAAELDALVRDGDAEQAGSQPFTMVFSAGNSGPGSNTLTAPKEGKNLIVVAASNNVRTLTGGTASADAIASFSSRGPAMDGRVIPHVAAPGVDIVSPRSTASAVCNLPPQDAGATMYGFCSGTSMAAPHVSGAVALLTEWWRSAGHGNPSPALAKALLVNTAEDLFRKDVPNPDEGWGRVNLGNLFDATVSRVINDQSTVLTMLDETHERQVEVTDPGRPLRITLAWTDAPAAPVTDPADAALVNDLDLEVLAPDGTTVFRGNVFDDGASAPGGDPDRLDNLENVFIPAPQIGIYTVRVRAHALPGDGVPGRGDTTDQDFALVVSGASPADGDPAVTTPSNVN
ncbi:MAG: S8 family serine peptidase [Nitriliruptorales bacterium]|nr:S8 family serine peptidase [Nitriliruptorales bacterium]